MRRFEESIHAGKRALALVPQANAARKYVAISLAQLGRIDEARAEIAELIKHGSHETSMRGIVSMPD